MTTMSDAVLLGPLLPQAVPSWGCTRRASFAVVFLAGTLSGCSGVVSGTAGDEGTVDLVKAQQTAANNPDLAKKSKKLGGGLGSSPDKRGKGGK